MRRRGEVRSPEALGRLLAQGRMLSGKSQRELAAEIGVGQKWIWELEQGKPGLFTERLFQVLRATGVTLSLEIDVPDGSVQGG
ncbi:helix-turn-helix domain-containing protein [Kineococcus rhizosphaerae]|uniref:Helix-turn-helix protein n=1 Tax=Kineococcus rhizosphaerae TaxID=559628 RepID=A0A2T0QX20_9ACTN|nr:helix-turn-helix domain-containing protein [Kineococcus rhizosphaerae]PRY10255.1 helix-turn-helix protein [Kineococcus rhizosphaerae]